MAQKDTQGAELASKVSRIYIITFPTVIIFYYVMAIVVLALLQTNP